MQKIVMWSLALLVTVAAPAAAQRGGAPRGGHVTFAVSVSDSSGAPVSDVRVTLSGPAQRASRTEAGRIVFEDLPAGAYTFRFEKDGFVPLEKEVTGRGVKPIDVKVTLAAAPAPPTPVTPVAAPPSPPPSADVKPVVLDMPAFIEKNYVGRASGKTTPLGCATGGSGTLIQTNDAIATHTHDTADEFIYVIAGQGTVKLGARDESLGPGVYLLIPRGLAHAFSTGPKKPLVMISIRSGETCAGDRHEGAPSRD